MFSLEPNYQQQVPKIWSEFIYNLPEVEKTSVLSEVSSKHMDIELIGVVGVIDANDDMNAIPYWAGSTAGALLGTTSLDTIDVPAQEYAVIPFTGPIKQLEQVLAWLFSHWIPDSNYDSVDGYELEIYPVNYDPEDSSSYMEYWLPIEPRS